MESAVESERGGSTILRYGAWLIYGVTALVFCYGFLIHKIRLTVADFWFLALVFVVPSTLVLGALWVLLNEAWWRVLAGLFLLLPAGSVWILVLLYAIAGFRIH